MKNVTIQLLRKNVKKALIIYEIWIVIFIIFSIYRFATKNYSMLLWDIIWLFIGILGFFSRHNLLKHKKELISKTVLPIDIIKRDLLIGKFFIVILFIIFIISLITFFDLSVGILLLIIYRIIDIRLVNKYLKQRK